MVSTVSLTLAGHEPPLLFDELADRIRRALAQLPAFEVDAAHARLRRELVEHVRRGGEVAAAQLELLLRQHDDRAALRRFVGERRELRRIGELLLGRRRAPGGTPTPGGRRA